MTARLLPCCCRFLSCSSSSSMTAAVVAVLLQQQGGGFSVSLTHMVETHPPLLRLWLSSVIAMTLGALQRKEFAEDPPSHLVQTDRACGPAY